MLHLRNSKGDRETLLAPSRAKRKPKMQTITSGGWEWERPSTDLKIRGALALHA